MADRPILFSAPMVRALLDGRKTMTRRIIKPQPFGRISPIVSFNHGRMEIAFSPDMKSSDGGPTWWRPRAQAGDRLWVRETWGGSHGAPTAEEFAGGVPVFYRADPKDAAAGIDVWRPSIHMPRWASRLTLYVTDVRVERLQDISEADARAEGAGLYVPGHGFITEAELRADPGYSNFLAPCLGFEAIWTEINGPGAWAQNPWVSVTTFVPRLGNIDSLPATLASETEEG